MKSSSSNPVLAYIKSAFEEFGKVTWPTREQATLLTTIVVGVSVSFGILLGALDLGFSQGYQLMLDKIPSVQTDTAPTATATTEPVTATTETPAPATPAPSTPQQ